MKRVIKCIVLSCCLFPLVVFSQETKSVINKKNHNIYNKYLLYPLRKSSADIYSGKIYYKMYVWQNLKDEPVVYNCEMDFLRWPLNEFFLPKVKLTIGDSVSYIIENDSIYIYNEKNQIQEVETFQYGIEFFAQNPFLNFYAQWFDLIGHISKINWVQSKNLLSFDFIIEEQQYIKYQIAKEGEHQFIYNKDSLLIKKYIYLPTEKLQKSCSFAKIQYELVDYQQGQSCLAWVNLDRKYKNFIVSNILREQRMSLMLGQNRENIIKRLNVDIDIVKSRKTHNEPNLPYFAY